MNLIYYIYIEGGSIAVLLLIKKLIMHCDKTIMLKEKWDKFDARREKLIRFRIDKI